MDNQISVGELVDFESANRLDMQECYESILVDCLETRAKNAGKNPEDHHAYIQSVVSWIQSTDFYTAPASTRFHDSFRGGLLFHTLKVYNEAMQLSTLRKFQNVELDSIALCSLVHDWCKIGLYESYLKNVKNEVTGQWEQQTAYKFKNLDHPFGHGVTSLYIALKFFKLTEEEALAIRWHMGAWYRAENESNDLQQANENYPLVHMLQFADQLSIVNY